MLPHLSTATMLLVWPPSGAGCWVALGRAAGVGRVRVTGGDRGDQRLVVDQAPPGGGEGRAEQAGDRDADEARVADVGVAVGVGQPGGLQVVEQGGGPGFGGQVVPAQDVQRLAHGGPAARGRRHAVDVQAAVADVGRRLDPGLVGAQVVHGHDAGQRDHALPGRQHRVVVGLDDGLAERAVVQVGRAVAGQQPVGLGQVGVAEQVTHGQRVAGRGEQPVAGRVGLQFGQAGLGELLEVGVDPEPALGHPDRGLQVLGQAVPAVPADGLGPGGDHGRDAGGQRLIRGVVVAVRLAGLRVDEHRRGARGRAVLAAVDGHHLVGLGQVDDHEPAAAGAGHERDGHAQRAGRGHGGVDGVAAVGEDVDAGLGGVGVHRGHPAAGPDRDRLLHRAARVLASGGAGSGRKGQEDHGQGADGGNHWDATHEHLRPVDPEMGCLFLCSETLTFKHDQTSGWGAGVAAAVAGGGWRRWLAAVAGRWRLAVVAGAGERERGRGRVPRPVRTNDFDLFRGCRGGTPSACGPLR